MIFKNPKYILAYFVMVGILAWLWYHFTDLEALYGNYGALQFWIDTATSWVNILGFPMFIVAWLYRAYTLGSVGREENAGFAGGILGILISGTMCCGSSVFLAIGASAVSNFFSKFFPYGGLELKIFGVVILMISLVFLLKNLLVCKVKPKK